MTTGASDLRRLTSLRTFAALAVFANHVGLNNNWLWHDRYTRIGYAGVAFFFVLSGFVLAWASRPADTASGFYIRRIARVYPSLVVALALSIALTTPTVTGHAIAGNLLLVNAWAPPKLNTLNDVSWSLSVEAFFYALAPFVLATGHRLPLRRFLRLLLAAAAATCIVRLVWSLTDHQDSRYLYEQPVLRLGEFLLGVALAFAVRSGWRPRIPISAAAGLALVVGLLLAARRTLLPGAINELILVPTFALIIIAAATADLRCQRGILHQAWLVYAGKVSFAFYLLHQIVLTLVSQHLNLVPPKTVGAAYTIVTLLLAFAAAAAMHHVIEKPLQRRIVTAANTRLPVPSLR